MVVLHFMRYKALLLYYQEFLEEGGFDFLLILLVYGGEECVLVSPLRK